MASVFTEHDYQLQRRVYEAFENGTDANSIASIRDEAVARQSNASAFIVAFSTILQSHNVRCSSPQWLRFNECLKVQNIAKEKQYWKPHLEHMAFISMQWSPEIVSDYNWTAKNMKRDQLILLYKCAQIYPHFKEDFLPQINLVWWLQYTADLPNIDKWTATPDRVFRNKDLQCLLNLHKSGTATICGFEIDHDSAANHYGQYIRTWTESEDGHVGLPDRTIDLQALKSKYWNMYALCTDKYGLLKQRARAQWTVRQLPAAVAQELHSYPFGGRSIEPEIVTNDRTNAGETATQGLRGSLGPAPSAGFCALAAGDVSNLASSDEPTGNSSESVDCPPSDMDSRKTPKVTGTREEIFEGETHDSHYNLRPEDCLCSICQDLRPFLNKMRSDHLRSGSDHLRRFREEWLSHAVWASKGDTPSSSTDGSSNLDIWCLDQSSLEELANDSSVLDKPIFVAETARDCIAHSMDSVQAAIRDNHCENEVEHFLALFSNNEHSTASYFLRGQFQAQDPQFMRSSRFAILQRASMRALNSLLASSDNSDQCCKDPLHTSLLASGLSSVRVETTGAASGPYISALGGSWFKSLVGKRLYALAKTSGLHSMQGDRRITSDQDWILSPIGKVQLILLEPNEVLILPPGIAFLHFAVDPSATLEGHFWDEKDIDRYLEATEIAGQHPSFASDIPPCVPQRALGGMQSIAQGRKSKSIFRQPSIDQASEQLSKRWRSCLPPMGSDVKDATIGASFASSCTLGTESDTRQKISEHGADCRSRAKRVCIR
jgi:hypothetical protein